MKTLLQPQTH